MWLAKNLLPLELRKTGRGRVGLLGTAVEAGGACRSAPCAAKALLTGATTCTYDGSPAPLTHPDALWELAARHRVTVFGTSPQYLLGMAKFGIDPSVHDLSSIRVVGCTGSTLPASAYPWVRDHLPVMRQAAAHLGRSPGLSAGASHRGPSAPPRGTPPQRRTAPADRSRSAVSGSSREMSMRVKSVN